MPDILIRGLAIETVKMLKEKARRNGRSLQGEARRVLEQSAGADGAEVARMLARWKRRFKGRRFSGSVELIRQDRKR